MGTQYSEVYEWFLKKVTYYSLEMLDDVDKEEIVKNWEINRTFALAITPEERDEKMKGWQNRRHRQLL